MSAAGLSDLPTEALDEIARRVGPFDDFTCSAVCRPWRRALKTTRLRRLKLPRQPYCLTLEPRCENWCERVPKEDRKIWTGKLCLSSSSWHGGSKDSVITVLDYDDGFPWPASILGCSHGWAVVLHGACALLLLEPLTGRRFPLPHISSCRSNQSKKLLKDMDLMGQRIFLKAALVPGRRLGTYAVMLIHSGGHGLLFLAPGAKSWTTLHAPLWTPKKYLDVVFHKGAFYTVSIDSQLNAWVPDGSTTGLRARLVADPQTEKVWAVLAESPTTRDDLLMVSTTNLQRCTTQALPLWKVSRYDEHQGKWCPGTYHGDTKIMVGEINSLCVPKGSTSISSPISAEGWNGQISYSGRTYAGNTWPRCFLEVRCASSILYNCGQRRGGWPVVAR